MNPSELTSSMYTKIAQVQGMFVSHPTVTKMLMKFRDAMSYRVQTGQPKNFLVYGRPGVGKTSLRKCIEQEFPPINLADRILYPVLSITIPSRPTVKNVAEEILVSLGDPCFSKGSSTDKTNRIINAVRNHGVQMFVFDEMQHFVDGGNKNSPREVSDWLKVLIDISKASTILLGGESVREILHVNTQLRRRFSAVMELRPFDIANANDAKHFASIIRHFDRQLGLPNRIDIQDSNLIIAFHFATFGVMDYIVKLMTKAYELAIENGNTQITRNLLEEAFTESIWIDGVGSKNPFNREFEQKYLDYEVGMPFKS